MSLLAPTDIASYQVLLGIKPTLHQAICATQILTLRGSLEHKILIMRKVQALFIQTIARHINTKLVRRNDRFRLKTEIVEYPINSWKNFYSSWIHWHILKRGPYLSTTRNATGIISLCFDLLYLSLIARFQAIINGALASPS
jgi:hypothetical protein